MSEITPRQRDNERLAAGRFPYDTRDGKVYRYDGTRDGVEFDPFTRIQDAWMLPAPDGSPHRMTGQRVWNKWRPVFESALNRAGVMHWTQLTDRQMAEARTRAYAAANGITLNE